MPTILEQILGWIAENHSKNEMLMNLLFMYRQEQRAKQESVPAETQVSLAEPSQLSKVLELFVKAAKSQKAWLDESYLQHSILCNYPHTHNKDDATFCNCGLTDLQYALREYDKLCKK